MTVQDLLDCLALYTANLDVCVQIDGGDMDYDLIIEEYPVETPTEVRISANGDTTKLSVSDVITDLEALTADLPVVAQVNGSQWGNIVGAHEIPDEGESTDVLLVAFYEVPE